MLKKRVIQQKITQKEEGNKKKVEDIQKARKEKMIRNRTLEKIDQSFL